MWKKKKREKLPHFCLDKISLLQHMDWKALIKQQGRDIGDGMIRN